MRIRQLFIFSLLFVLSHVSAEEVAPIDWANLNTEQKHILAPFKERWPEIAPARQLQLRKAANRWLVMPETQREKVKNRFTRLFQMRDSQLQSRLRRYDELNEQERAIVHKQFLLFQAMSDERRQELTDKWRGLSEEEKKQYRQSYAFSVDEAK